MSAYLKYLFQLILSPSRGWEDLSHDGADPDELLRRGLYPLTGITALSEFLQLFYSRYAGFGSVLQAAISATATNTTPLESPLPKADL